MPGISEAFEVIRTAMIKDDPSKPGSYAHGWHCNIAMACFDAMKNSGVCRFDDDFTHSISNDAATRFMKLCFGVDTKG